MVAIGDHGYDLRYLEAKDYTPPLTVEQFTDEARADWAKDKRPPAEFAAGAYTVHQPSGGVVSASGLMPVADAMFDWCGRNRCQFGVMLGDNIYPDGATLGADGKDDADRFRHKFADPYGRFRQFGGDFRFYATLGNHDWHTSRDAAMAQVDYLAKTPPFYMDGLIYRVSPPETRGEVELFVLDTQVLLAGRTFMEDALADDGSEIPSTKMDELEPWAKPQTPLEAAQAAWLAEALTSSKARWKIVIGHHPLWASAGGKYRQSEALRAAILPVLCEHADLYLAGHEHTLEAFTDSCAAALPGKRVAPLPAIVSGAAGKQRPLNTAFMRHQLARNPGLKQLHAQGMIWGAAHLTLAPETATITFITTPNDGSGKPVQTGSYSFPRRTEL
ncbi:metallophosphoesterase [Polymorphobacter sp.]|uniref:metallophosphoesterase n=1 Tax=Polymorphobacter sp. TaxID=1909290 RepID=UPI003F6FD009